jgi:hypothetical protein
MFKNIYYKTMAWLLYKAGDILCNLDYEWSWNLYQKCMLLSYDYDEQVNFWIWKEPALDEDENL